MKEKEVTTDGQVPQTKKLTYEQLEQYCSQLEQQARMLHQRLQETANVFRRLDYLFKILENQTCFSPSYIDDVVKEIQEIMTIPEEENTEETKE